MNYASQMADLKNEAKALAARYYELTGKPLGKVGGIAEIEAVELLGLHLADARAPGFDAYRDRDAFLERIQIKCGAVDSADRFRGRCPAIKCGNQFDFVLTVLLDRRALDVLEIWEAPEAAVQARLSVPGSKARNERNSMGLSQFKSIAERIWPPLSKPVAFTERHRPVRESTADFELAGRL